MMPTFKEVVSVLMEYPSKKLLVNVKDTYTRTQFLLLYELAGFPEAVRSRVYVEFQKQFENDFQRLSVPEAIWQTTGVKKCFVGLITPHPIDNFPESCKGKKYFIPLHQDMGAYDPTLKGTEFVSLVPGWPDVFLRQASESNSEIYLSQVNSELDFNFSQKHSFKGIMTDRIEFIAPLLPKKRYRRAAN